MNVAKTFPTCLQFPTRHHAPLAFGAATPAQSRAISILASRSNRLLPQARIQQYPHLSAIELAAQRLQHTGLLIRTFDQGLEDNNANIRTLIKEPPCRRSRKHCCAPQACGAAPLAPATHLRRASSCPCIAETGLCQVSLTCRRSRRRRCAPSACGAAPPAPAQHPPPSARRCPRRSRPGCARRSKGSRPC